MRIIPAIDIIDGKAVRLSQGDYGRKKIYNESPLEVAKAFEANGIKSLHLVDLDGARAQKIVNWAILNDITSKTSLKVDFGGGLKTEEAVKIAFDNGANQITGGSIAMLQPELFKSWLSTYGSDKVILGADVKNEKIAINGWEDCTTQDLFPFIQGYSESGIEYVICTDISKDGMLAGSSIELYKNIRLKFPELKLIASGGVTNRIDLEELSEMGCEGVIIGKALYENRITLKELQAYVD